jgi:hypothetical protein
MKRTRLLLPSLLACAVLAHAAVPGDPPSRVARLAYLRGSVSYSPAGVDDWALASLNRPLVAGDRVWTEPGARDELQVGNAAIRMDGGTLLTVLNLDDRLMQAQLTQGTLNIRVRSLPNGGAIEVDTPNLAFSIQRPGHYRIGVDPSGSTTLVRVADGQAEAIGRDRAYLINPGQAYRFGGTDLADVQLADAARRDDFDRWSAARDSRAERSRASRYVSPTMIGYEDLDDNGTWRNVDGYGPVWMPTHVSRDWAPYRDGHWAWIDPWGWTWVDDAPWGFATTHYGRWANMGGDWGWVPGPAAATPVYAPALVMFVAGARVAEPRRQPGDGVAWFPLAPRETYRPPYHASPRYLASINNDTGGKAADKRYANRQVAGAVTAVPAAVFARAQPVRRAAVALPKEAIASAQLAPAATVKAQRESLASHFATGHRPAPAALSRQVMVHNTPSPVAAPAAHPLPAAQVRPAPAVPVPPLNAGKAHNPHERNIAAEPHMPAPTPMPAPVRPLPPHAMPAAPMPPAAGHGAMQAAMHRSSSIPPATALTMNLPPRGPHPAVSKPAATVSHPPPQARHVNAGPAPALPARPPRPEPARPQPAHPAIQRPPERPAPHPEIQHPQARAEESHHAAPPQHPEPKKPQPNEPHAEKDKRK